MNILKLTIAAATFTVGLAATASAMPVGKIAPGASTQVEQVRLVCNRFGRCWRTGGYAYGYRSGYYRGGYRRGWRGDRNWR